MMHSSFEQQLEDRLTIIETSSPAAVTVPDLPLRDLIGSAIVLAVVIVGLLWWAY